MANPKKTVVVLGASNKPDRYSNKAVKLLLKMSYTVIPVHPKLETVEGIAVKHNLSDIQGPVDTLTVYVSPEISKDLLYEIIDLHPKRVILNPGTESPEIIQALEKECIPYHQACTLVLLNTGAF
jgi:predicted CoA-binding protein